MNNPITTTCPEIEHFLQSFEEELIEYPAYTFEADHSTPLFSIDEIVDELAMQFTAWR
jgi:hypothetical protein